jgi:type IV pili sensor histidine kinase/response regulator
MKRIFPVLLAIALVSALFACATQEQEAKNDPIQVVPPKDETVRYGRYTAVSTTPSAEQVDLLSQIVDTKIPSSMNPTVREALDHVIQRTGYSICPPPTPEVETLYALPLPAAHYRIGPTPLRYALQFLAGSAYTVEVNEITRTICFVVKPDYVVTSFKGTAKDPAKDSEVKDTEATE